MLPVTITVTQLTAEEAQQHILKCDQAVFWRHIVPGEESDPARHDDTYIGWGGKWIALYVVDAQYIVPAGPLATGFLVGRVAAMVDGEEEIFQVADGLHK